MEGKKLKSYPWQTYFNEFLDQKARKIMEEEHLDNESEFLKTVTRFYIKSREEGVILVKAPKLI